LRLLRRALRRRSLLRRRLLRHGLLRRRLLRRRLPRRRLLRRRLLRRRLLRRGLLRRRLLRRGLLCRGLGGPLPRRRRGPPGSRPPRRGHRFLGHGAPPQDVVRVTVGAGRRRSTYPVSPPVIPLYLRTLRYHGCP